MIQEKVSGVPAVVITDLTIAFGDTTILDGVNLSVDAGTHLSIIGPNGAGKTTLLRALAGMIQIVAGTIRIWGDVSHRLMRKELARRISYVPQASHRSVPFSVKEFITLSRYPYLNFFSTLSPADRRVVETTLEQSGLACLAHRRMDSLSGGERQKVFIAAALAQEADILLLDEPTTFLDYRHQVEILEMIRRLNQSKHTTVIMVTHDINTALQAGGNVAAIRDRRIVFHGSAHELVSTEILQSIFDTSFDIIPRPDGALPFIVPSISWREPPL